MNLEEIYRLVEKAMGVLGLPVRKPRLTADLIQDANYYIGEGMRLSCGYTNSGVVNDETTLAELVDRHLKSGLTREEITVSLKEAARSHHKRQLQGGNKYGMALLELMSPGYENRKSAEVSRRIYLVYALR